MPSYLDDPLSPLIFHQKNTPHISDTFCHFHLLFIRYPSKQALGPFIYHYPKLEKIVLFFRASSLLISNSQYNYLNERGHWYNLWCQAARGNASTQTIVPQHIQGGGTAASCDSCLGVAIGIFPENGNSGLSLG
jgi:hypothetical protein